jgi:DNA gyrase subunit A
VSEFKEGLDLVTMHEAKGLVKRTALKAYANIRQTGIIGVAIEEGDALLARRGRPKSRTRS